MDRSDIILYLTKKGYTGLHLYPREDLLELHCVLEGEGIYELFESQG